ncbi:MAG: hypothetical protein AVDCRST_MAG02-4082, partial [uncultured Rubrobacteraceae bacterium]
EQLGLQSRVARTRGGRGAVCGGARGGAWDPRAAGGGRLSRRQRQDRLRALRRRPPGGAERRRRAKDRDRGQPGQPRGLPRRQKGRLRARLRHLGDGRRRHRAAAGLRRHQLHHVLGRRPRLLPRRPEGRLQQVPKR